MMYTQPPVNPLEILVSSLTFVSELNDPRIGNLKIFTNKPTREYLGLISRELDVNSAQMFEAEVTIRSKTIHPHLISVVGFHKEPVQDSQRRFIRCTLGFEWFQCDLEMELKKRVEKKVEELLI